jgi:hypothetical protein
MLKSDTHIMTSAVLDEIIFCESLLMRLLFVGLLVATAFPFARTALKGAIERRRDARR